MCDGANKHRQRWRAAGWRPRVLARSEICNAVRWQLLDELLRARGVGHDEIVWVKGHTSAEQVRAGEVTPFNHAGNNAADMLATTGAALHCVPAAEVAAAAARVELAVRLQRMILEIAMARAAALRTLDRLTEPRAQDGVRPGARIAQTTEEEAVDAAEAAPGPETGAPVSEQIELYPWGWAPPHPQLGMALKLKRSLRRCTVTRYDSTPARERPTAAQFCFPLGATMWRALNWWIEQLRWPAADCDRASGGVTWAELAIDFEVATGVDLPPVPRALIAADASLEGERIAPLPRLVRSVRARHAGDAYTRAGVTDPDGRPYIRRTLCGPSSSHSAGRRRSNSLTHRSPPAPSRGAGTTRGARSWQASCASWAPGRCRAGQGAVQGRLRAWRGGSPGGPAGRSSPAQRARRACSGT